MYRISRKIWSFVCILDAILLILGSCCKILYNMADEKRELFV